MRKDNNFFVIVFAVMCIIGGVLTQRYFTIIPYPKEVISLDTTSVTRIANSTKSDSGKIKAKTVFKGDSIRQAHYDKYESEKRSPTPHFSEETYIIPDTKSAFEIPQEEVIDAINPGHGNYYGEDSFGKVSSMDTTLVFKSDSIAVQVSYWHLDDVFTFSYDWTKATVENIKTIKEVVEVTVSPPIWENIPFLSTAVAFLIYILVGK